jgi:hypothetical protein
MVLFDETASQLPPVEELARTVAIRPELDPTASDCELPAAAPGKKLKLNDAGEAVKVAQGPPLKEKRPVGDETSWKRGMEVIAEDVPTAAKLPFTVTFAAVAPVLETYTPRSNSSTVNGPAPSTSHTAVTVPPAGVN